MQRFSALASLCISTSVALAALAVTVASADQTNPALPAVGVTQSYAATQQYQSPGGYMPPGAMQYKGVTMPHDQSGTLMLNRTAPDQVHLTASGGLDAFDATQHVDNNGRVAQPSSPYPFIDLLNDVSAMMANAPASLQKDATWKATIDAPGWESVVVGGSMPKQMKSLDVTMRVVSVSGNTTQLHGDGKMVTTEHTISGDTSATIETTLDCTLVSGQMQRCAVVHSEGVSFAAMNVNMSIADTVTMTKK